MIISFLLLPEYPQMLAFSFNLCLPHHQSWRFTSFVRVFNNQTAVASKNIGAQNDVSITAEAVIDFSAARVKARLIVQDLIWSTGESIRAVSPPLPGFFELLKYGRVL